MLKMANKACYYTSQMESSFG